MLMLWSENKEYLYTSTISSVFVFSSLLLLFGMNYGYCWYKYGYYYFYYICNLMMILMNREMSSTAERLDHFDL